MAAYSSDSHLTRLEAEVGAATVSPKPDHSVTVDLEDFEYLPLIRLEPNLIFVRQPSSARCNRLYSYFRANLYGSARIVYGR